jgi:hypothetical protein
VTPDGPRSTGARAELARRSRPLLVALARLPRVVILVVVLSIVVGGFLLPGVLGGLLLGLVGLFLLWLVALAWPSLGSGARALRLLVGLAVVAYAIVKMFS